MIKAFIVGILVGGIFCYFDIQVPAPSTFEGILGIIGLWVGWNLIAYLIEILK